MTKGRDSAKMTPESWAALEPAFDAALDLPPGDRRAYVDRVSAADPALGDALRQALADSQRSDPLLERAAAERFALLLSDEELAPGLLLDERFFIEREIGRGGMATVYRALDRKHDRVVAVKVLRPGVVAAIGADRFLREVKIVARLQHPHIVPLYDSGATDGKLYYVMPLMSGTSLRQRLTGQPRLPLADVMRIVREIGDALDYAHGQGLVHRDVKPENILFDGERALLADFGIARATTTASGEYLTGSGISIGTPSYMSPEQASGHSEIDARSDVYSFACVVYEMLSGAPPFVAPSRHEVMAMHLRDAAPSVLDARPEIPRSVADAVRIGLSKNPRERHLSMRAFVDALTQTDVPSVAGANGEPKTHRFPGRLSERFSGRTAALIAGVVIVVLAAAAWRSSHDPAVASSRRRIAVIPFASLAGDSADATVRRYAAMVLMQGLSRTDSFDVISATAVNAVTAGPPDRGEDMLKRLSASLRPDLVVTAVFGRLGDSLHLNAAVIESRTGVATHIVSSAMPLADTLGLINDVTERLLGSMLTGKFGRWLAITGPPPTYAAYLEFEAGLDRRTHRSGRPYYERALARDSNFVRAYFSVADGYFNTGMFDSVSRTLDLLEGRRLNLSPADRLMIEEFRAELGGDLERALAAANEYWARTSDPYGAHVVGLLALQLVRPDVGIAAFRATGAEVARFGLATVTGDGNAMYLSRSLHQAARYAEQLAVIRQARQYATAGGCRCPPPPLLAAFAGLHDDHGAVAFADSLLAAAADPADLRPTNAVRVGAAEFRAHARSREDVETANRLDAMALSWFERHPDAGPSFARDTANALAWLARGDLDSATSYLRVASRDTLNIGVAGHLGLIAAQRRDTGRARAIGDSLVKNVRKWDHGAAAYWRGAILSALGESDDAIRSLRQAQGLGQSMEPWHYANELAPLRGKAQFEALIAKR